MNDDHFLPIRGKVSSGPDLIENVEENQERWVRQVFEKLIVDIVWSYRSIMKSVEGVS